MEEAKVLIFIQVDEQGNIIEMLKGANVIPDREYDFFFVRDESEAELITLSAYKVVMSGFRAEIVLKDSN